MAKSNRLRLNILCITVFAGSIIFFLGMCTRTSTPSDEALLASVPDDYRRLLIEGDDSTLARYARENGFDEIRNIVNILGFHLKKNVSDDRRYETYRIFYYLERVGRVMATEFNYPFILENVLENMDRDWSLLRENFRLIEEAVRISRDTVLTQEEKIRIVSNHMQLLAQRNHRGASGLSKSLISDIYAEAGNQRELMRYLKEAIAAFSEIGYHKMTCQSLGVLGALYEENGDIDSMMICYDRALEIAMACKMASEIARIYAFYAGYYNSHGRPALSHEFYNRAIGFCKKYKAGSGEIRFLVRGMFYYADLSCWHIVARLIERARLLERKYSSNADTELQTLRIDLVEARMKMSLGAVDEAISIFEEIKEPVIMLSYLGEYPCLLYYWAIGLVQNGRYEEAAAVIAEGMDRAASEHVTKYVIRFALLHVENERRLGRTDDARHAISMFDSLASGYEEANQREFIKRDALLGHIELDACDTAAAVAALDRGMSRLRSYVRGWDASVHSYLWLEECEEFRRFLHRITRNDPATGYGAELVWRDLFRMLGDGTRTRAVTGRPVCISAVGGEARNKSISGAILEECRARAQEAMDRVSRRKAIHCLYAIQEEEIWRWTVTSEGIRFDVIACDTERLHQLVHDTYSSISGETAGPATALASPLRSRLRALAGLLLPAGLHGLRSMPAGSQILVSPDGFLNRIPFETFDIGDDDAYHPVLEKYDVVYLRSDKRPSPAMGGDPGVVLVSEGVGYASGTRHTLKRELTGAIEEGRMVLSLQPDATLLTGEHAIKSRLMNLWKEASFIYVAGHTLRNPEIPYMVLIPLEAASGRVDPAASYLDIMDVRSTDLSRCEIVVLSGCSSGASYVTTSITGPSLGDAFLDAGSGSVVQTFWDVKDNEARDLMEAFMHRWKRKGVSKEAALCEIRREALRGPDGIRHPSLWASYYINISGL